MKKQKCAIYCRVSTGDQDISKQLDLLPEYAKKQNWEVFETYVDDGISGASVDARPDFKRLLDDMINQRFEILLVEYLDRVTRTENLAERGLIMQTIKENNIILWSPSEGSANLKEFTGEFMSTFKFIMAAKERQRIKERTLGGKKAKMKKGIPCSGGRWPFARAYNKETNEWTLDEKKASAIRWAAQEYLKGVSLRKIEKDLQLKHSLQVLYNTLLRTFKISCGDTWTVNFSDGISKDFKIPPILDDMTIKAVNERIKFNRINNRDNVKKYALNGFLKCEKCHRSLNGQRQIKNGKTYSYYRHPVWTKGEKDTCGAFRAITAEKIEKAVFSVIFETVGDTPGFQKAIKESLPDTNLIKTLKDKIAKGRKALKKIERQLDKLVDMVLGGTLKKETIKKKESQLLESKNDIENELIKNQEKYESLPSIEQVQKNAEKIRQALKKRFKSEQHLQTMDYDAKREILYRLFPQGHDKEGKPYGIFLKKRKSRTWEFSIIACIFDTIRLIKGIDYKYKGDDVGQGLRETLNKKRHNNYITSKGRAYTCYTQKGLQGCCKVGIKKV
jgi:site-specific DNA recombinase